MKYDRFEEENFNIDCLSITKRLDNLNYSRWHFFIIACLGPSKISSKIKNFFRCYVDFRWI